MKHLRPRRRMSQRANQYISVASPLQENHFNPLMLNPYAACGNFFQYKMMQKTSKMTETIAHRYSSESTQQELSNEYQHDRVKMFFKNLCIIVLWTKVASALAGLRFPPASRLDL